MTASLIAVSVLLWKSEARYTLVEKHEGSSFFSNFTFFTDPDPTHGFVKYVDEAEARSSGLIGIEKRYGGREIAWMGVDYKNVTPKGRPSVRIESKTRYNKGLWIADFAHVPGAACGSWPAYWLLGPEWPNSGEIDIYEGVNLALSNDMTLHTGLNCSITSDTPFTGRMTKQNCDTQAPPPDGDGCQIAADDLTSFGTGMNIVGGGVYATEWTADNIKIWYFSRILGIPEDIMMGQPDPSKWGVPVAVFAGKCDFDRRFEDLQIVFDTTFCGDWAGNKEIWGNSTCSAITATCQEFVEKFPGAFAESYWAVNYVKVYQWKEVGGKNISLSTKSL